MTAAKRLVAGVSIHAPARGATHYGEPVWVVEDVSIHAPARGATCETENHRDSSRGFNPRARAGRDGIAGSPATRASRFQSTRPRGARHHRDQNHALALDVSIHAPARGATQSESEYGTIPVSFNPRARAGRDAHQSVRVNPRRLVSIHAPARGATSAPLALTNIFWFQSTRPRGARHLPFPSHATSAVFQSTRPRGARLFRSLFAMPMTLFQSTRPRGARRRPVCN